ncbi:MAG: AAA family ATPase [Planctomycetia bacterium]|nr:AAA family ATPase [Planctomycetia bacterium]
MNGSSRLKIVPRARFITGGNLFSRWHDDVKSGTAPVLYQHGFPYPEVGPGLVTLIGGAPGAGKTCFTTSMGIEMLRFQPGLRVLMANCEMAPEALLNRQLARLSGIDAEAIRHRRLGPEHEERLTAGLATLQAVIDRLAFMNAPYDISNVAASVDAFGADVVFIDYIQRFTIPTEDAEARHRVNRVMDYLRQFANAGLAVIVVSAVGRSRDKAGRSSYAGDGLSLASFRETSELEYGADDALILAPIGDDSDLVRLSHLKARHGRQVTQEFRFNRSVQSFTLVSSDATPASWTPPVTTDARSATRTSVTEELLRLWDSGAVADDDAPLPNEN